MFAVILLPNFRLQAALRYRDELCGRAVALTDANEAKTGLLEISAAAARAGVSPGQSASQALARCPALTLLSRSLAQESAGQAMLLEVATTLSPEVEATADGYATVNLHAARTRDWQVLAERTVEALAALHFSAQAGIGPNPDIAFLAARYARPALVVRTPATFLSNLAIHELDPPPELLSVLRDWGVHNLGQLTSLPRGELMDRLGPEAARLWERAAGQAERPLRLVRPKEEFSEACDFEHEIDTAEPVLFLLRRFLDQLTLRLHNAWRVAGRMTFTLLLENGSAHERSFTVPSPTASADVLFRILHTHLDGLRLEHRAIGMRLLIEPTQSERQQFQLFESPVRDPNRLGETLGRLAALVGAENVGVPEPLDTHKPDSFRLVPPRFHEPGQNDAVGAAAQRSTGILPVGTAGFQPAVAQRAAIHSGQDARCPHRQDACAATTSPDNFATGLPLRRWRPPMAAEVRVVRHRPAFIVSEKVRGVIRDALGPYRASGGWWERDRWATEEWDIETDDGIFRLRRDGREWLVEGSYDD